MLLLLLLLLLLAAPRRRRVSLDSRRRYSCLVGLPSSRFVQLSSMGLSRFSCILVHCIFIRNVILSAHVAIDHKVHIYLVLQQGEFAFTCIFSRRFPDSVDAPNYRYIFSLVIAPIGSCVLPGDVIYVLIHRILVASCFSILFVRYFILLDLP